MDAGRRMNAVEILICAVLAIVLTALSYFFLGYPS